MQRLSSRKRNFDAEAASQEAEATPVHGRSWLATKPGRPWSRLFFLRYSYLNASTGLAVAARLACNAIVSHATASAAAAAIRNIQTHSPNGAR